MYYFCICANLQTKRKIVFIRILNCIKIDQIIITQEIFISFCIVIHYITKSQKKVQMINWWKKLSHIHDLLLVKFYRYIMMNSFTSSLKQILKHSIIQLLINSLLHRNFFGFFSFHQISLPIFVLFKILHTRCITFNVDSATSLLHNPQPIFFPMPTRYTFTYRPLQSKNIPRMH